MAGMGACSRQEEYGACRLKIGIYFAHLVDAFLTERGTRRMLLSIERYAATYNGSYVIPRCCNCERYWPELLSHHSSLLTPN